MKYVPAWMKASTIAMTGNHHKRFHQEILDFAEWSRVKDYTVHERLFSKLKRIMGRNFPNAKFVLFGSAGA